MLDLRLTLRRYSAAFLILATACATNTSITGISGPIPPSSLTPRQTAFLDTLERRTFNWFWDQSDPNTGLTPDRWPTKSFSSVAAIGFALTAYPVGVERGYVSRTDAAQRSLNALRFMYNAPQGPQPTNVTGYKGFFYHFLDMQTGYRFQQVELSTIDTSLLLGGVLFCQSYFTGADPTENAIRAYADSMASSMIHDLNVVLGLLGHMGVTDVRPVSGSLFASGQGTAAVLALNGDQAICQISHVVVPKLADYQERISLFFDDRRFELIFPSPYLNHFQTRLIAYRSEGMHLSTTEHRNGFEEAFVRELIGFWDAIVNGAPVRNTAEHARADIDLIQRIARLAFAGLPT